MDPTHPPIPTQPTEPKPPPAPGSPKPSSTSSVATLDDVRKTIHAKLHAWIGHQKFSRFRGRARAKDYETALWQLTTELSDLAYDYASGQVQKATADRPEYMKRLDQARQETHQLRTYVRQLRSFVELSVRVLQRGRAQKKKATALRTALGTLEAALSDPEPGSKLDPKLLAAILLGGMGMIGAYGYWKTVGMKKQAATAPSPPPS